MRIGKIPVLRRIQKRLRRKRLEAFLSVFAPPPGWKILDIGGTVPTWEFPELEGLSATLLNLTAPVVPERLAGRIDSVAGDATKIGFPDRSFDLVFSNSVIEHVGTIENQRKFAGEALRVGERVWVQTPAREFFFEPHYITPFIHWVPVAARRRLVRWCTVWGIFGRPSKQEIEKAIAELRLLSKGEMRELFPGCEILEEKFLGMTKSYIAVRKSDAD